MKISELQEALYSVDQKSIEQLESLIKGSEVLFLIGNGGSNAIASHMAVDYIKFLNKICYVPNASDLVTMIVNDYGKEDMYSKFIDLHHQKDRKQLCVLISSSGNSPNIVNAAKKCFDLHIPMVVLSGFHENNALNSLQSDLIKLKFWVDSKSYGVVEMTHHSILHSVV
jgi:D-sedoheptulose 7-phosphate isomerase